mmetsp:Transcript_124328/g.310844  ORF Transcript_124328/g.310844 Transcript_124328/m.310844 type:complete len:294 (-) Transcript_124328:170-1051(-)
MLEELNSARHVLVRDHGLSLLDGILPSKLPFHAAEDQHFPHLVGVELGIFDQGPHLGLPLLHHAEGLRAAGRVEGVAEGPDGAVLNGDPLDARELLAKVLDVRLLPRARPLQEGQKHAGKLRAFELAGHRDNHLFDCPGMGECREDSAHVRHDRCEARGGLRELTQLIYEDPGLRLDVARWLQLLDRGLALHTQSRGNCPHHLVRSLRENGLQRKQFSGVGVVRVGRGPPRGDPCSLRQLLERVDTPSAHVGLVAVDVAEEPPSTIQILRFDDLPGLVDGIFPRDLFLDTTKT